MWPFNKSAESKKTKALMKRVEELEAEITRLSKLSDIISLAQHSLGEDILSIVTVLNAAGVQAALDYSDVDEEEEEDKITDSTDDDDTYLN